MNQDHPLTIDELIRECGDLRWMYELRNHASLRTASGQPINEATVARSWMEHDSHQPSLWEIAQKLHCPPGHHRCAERTLSPNTFRQH